MNLRTWQVEALKAWEANQDGSPVIWAIMGAGKSIAIAEICKRRSQDIIIITAPTIALVDQLSATVAAHTKELVGRWYTHANVRHRITVACHASLDSLDESEVDLWIADEAHKTECEEVKAWSARTPIAQRLGFTATPWRSSERESLSLFERCVYEYGPVQALRDGVVVLPKLVHPSSTDTLDDQCVAFIDGQTTPGVVNAQSIEDAERFAGKLSVPTMVVHSRGKDDARSARSFLQLGGARAVVYVNMLAEGFDAPEIMWLVARRRVGSRVRFAQEIGRGLRAHSGKTECLVFDPHRLFQRLSLSYEACLGELPPQDEVVPTLKLEDIGEDIADKILSVSAKNPLIRPLIQDYIYEVRCELQFRGLVEMKLSASSSKKSASWRKRDITEAQQKYIRGLFMAAKPHAPRWPARIRDVLRVVWHHVPYLDSGAGADLISVLKCADRINND